MNLLDYGIIAIFALFMVISVYQGFLVSLVNIASFFVSWLSAMIFSSSVASWIHSNQGLMQAMLYYTEGTEKIGNIELSRLAVSHISADQLNQVMANATLPSPINKLVEMNITGEVFASKGITTVGEYFNVTIVNFSINVISFLIVFLLVRLLLAFILHGVDYVIKLPTLRHFDGVLAGGFGFMRGFFAIFVIFMIVPLILLILPPTMGISEYIRSSFFGSFFYDSNFLLALIKGI